jgi:hypothetical protein
MAILPVSGLIKTVIKIEAFISAFQKFISIDAFIKSPCPDLSKGDRERLKTILATYLERMSYLANPATVLRSSAEPGLLTDLLTRMSTGVTGLP